ncbi:MAG: riboflavin synthase [Cytophagales bacterium]|nr:riboflavin synthase [Cytophagales bacterium]
MFTGIIETLGKIEAIREEGSGRHFLISSQIAGDLKVDQSLAHDGVCLTVTCLEGGSHWTTAIKETLSKTTLGKLQVGSLLNLERAMLSNGRFDGHIVQGHIDQTATIQSIRDEQGSWVFNFLYDPSAGNVTVEKGSICVNGVSLTCFDSSHDSFSVAVIPYTYNHTSFHQLKVGDTVNLEFDILVKYVKKLLDR